MLLENLILFHKPKYNNFRTIILIVIIYLVIYLSYNLVVLVFPNLEDFSIENYVIECDHI